jgi:aminotransferase
MLSLSKIASRVVQSEIRIMSVECEKVRGINLAQGICDTEVPPIVRRAATQAMEAGFNQYTRLDGLAGVRQAIARKMRDYNAMTVDPENEVLVTVGSTGAFVSACFALLDPGDEVVVFEPYYGYHVNTLLALGVAPAYVTLAAPDWKFTAADLERAATAKTRAIVINSPGNPSGKVFSREELEVVAEFARKHDLFVFTDEIYEYFLYEGREHISIATLPGMAERTITISGFSKTFSITGWRMGYAVCDRRWKPTLGYFHDLTFICAPAPFQKAVEAGLNELGPEFYRQLGEEYAEKRTLLCRALEDCGLAPSWPQGSYYVLADSSKLPGANSKEKAMALLQQTGVAAVPGEAFFHGDSGKNLLRFCFAKTKADLEAGCERLQKLRVAAAAR